MALVEVLQLILIIPKGIQSLLFLLNIILINKKYSSTQWKERPQFHKLFLMGLIGWFIYIALDILIYTVAGISMTELTPIGNYAGYLLEYPSLLIVNILRDIAFLGSMIMSWCYLIAAFALRFEEEKIKEAFTSNKIVLTIMIVISIIIIAGDIIQVSVEDTGITVSGIFNGFAGFAIILNVSVYVFSAILLYATLRSVAKDDPSKSFRRRITFFMWGVIFMGLGHIWWITLGIISIVNPKLLIFPLLMYFFIGHGFWIASPILIYFGFARKSSKND
jgi:hypothetical protein